MKISELQNIFTGLSQLAAKELPIKTSLKIQRNYQKVDDALKPSEEVNKKLVEQYKESDDGQGGVTLKKETAPEFHRKRAELLDEDVEVELESIGIEEIEQVAEGTIKTQTLILLDEIIKEEK